MKYILMFGLCALGACSKDLTGLLREPYVAPATKPDSSAAKPPTQKVDSLWISATVEPQLIPASSPIEIPDWLTIVSTHLTPTAPDTGFLSMRDFWKVYPESAKVIGVPIGRTIAITIVPNVTLGFYVPNATDQYRWIITSDWGPVEPEKHPGIHIEKQMNVMLRIEPSTLPYVVSARPSLVMERANPGVRYMLVGGKSQPALASVAAQDQMPYFFAKTVDMAPGDTASYDLAKDPSYVQGVQPGMTYTLVCDPGVVDSIKFAAPHGIFQTIVKVVDGRLIPTGFYAQLAVPPAKLSCPVPKPVAQK